MQPHKPRLSPLIEVIEPTPPLCRNAPIFGMTGLNDSDFNLSDLTSEYSDIEEAHALNNIQYKHEVPQFIVSSSTAIQKQSKTKLINNVNSYL